MWAALIGAVAATVGTTVLELVWKPLLSRHRAATVLVAEVRLNQRLLRSIAEHRHREPGRVSDTISLSTQGWHAVAHEIHHLPKEALESVLLRYAQFAEINRLVINYSRKVDMVLQLERGSMAQHAVHLESQRDEQVFGESVTAALAACDLTITKLQALVDLGPLGWS